MGSVSQLTEVLTQFRFFDFAAEKKCKNLTNSK